MIAFACGGRWTRMTIARSEYVFEKDWLNEQQKAADLHVLRSRDSVTAITGGADTGKMTRSFRLMERDCLKMKQG